MAIESIERLTVQLGKLPGIGRKTAARLAYHILGVPPEQAQELAQAITDARTKVHNCPVCGTYTDGELCEICADPRRRADVICVVSDPRDVIAMEKTREFNGRYHVLFGALSPMEGVGPKDIKINELLERCKGGEVKEVIGGGGHRLLYRPAPEAPGRHCLPHRPRHPHRRQPRIHRRGDAGEGIGGAKEFVR